MDLRCTTFKSNTCINKMLTGRKFNIPIWYAWTGNQYWSISRHKLHIRLECNFAHHVKDRCIATSKQHSFALRKWWKYVKLFTKCQTHVTISNSHRRRWQTIIIIHINSSCCMNFNKSRVNNVQQLVLLRRIYVHITRNVICKPTQNYLDYMYVIII